MRSLLDPLRALRGHLHPHFRAVRRADPTKLLQPSPHSALDRHPAMFAFVADQLPTERAPRILSYGCSTGEEPATLAGYMPNAAIDAIDINRHSIARARRKYGDRINFVCAAEPPGVTGVYDAIFCLSVLRHGDVDKFRPSNCADFLPFARFEALVGQLDAGLKQGGLMILWGCNFRFEDHPASARYEAIAADRFSQRKGVFYGRDDKLIDPRPPAGCIFRKRGSDDRPD